jgi:glyoxylase-like metal-dependent hydrolase (beta-lactamase superfamily II)
MVADWITLRGMVRVFSALVLLVVSATPAPSQTAAARTTLPGLAFDFTEVAPGVHVAIARGVPYYVSNSVVIVGDDDVLLVDSSASPAAGHVLRQAIRTMTTKPVRYIVNTHFHFDHALGDAAFPEAVMIGHVATRDGLGLGLRQPTLASNLAALPGRAAEMRARARGETDAEAREVLLRDAASTDAYAEDLAALVPAPPRLAFTDALTIWLGAREVRILHLGRGHTAGDTVIHLPAERIVCTGDLFNGYIGYMGDAYVDEWADTLDRLARLDFETVIAGHGKPFAGKQAIAPVQAVLRDLWSQVEAFKRRGVSATDAAAKVDLRAHASRFSALATPGYNPLAVERIYAVIDSRVR